MPGIMEKTIATAVHLGVPVLKIFKRCYLLRLRSFERPPGNLQAQRDFFGAHTYGNALTSQEDSFFTDWQISE